MNFKKGPQIRCIPHGRWGLAQCKSTCEEHAGSDISFGNTTLCLDQLRLKFSSQRKREHWKPWFEVEKRTRYLNINRAAKNKLLVTKNLSVNPIPWTAAALNTIYKANQSTNYPFKLAIVLKLAHQLGPLERATNSCTLNHPILNHEL